MTGRRPHCCLASAVVALLVAVGEGACRKAPLLDQGPIDVPAARADEDAAVAPAAARVLPARCPREGRSMALGDAGAQGELEIGDVVAFPAGYAIPFSREANVGRAAAVAWLGADAAGPARIIELGAAAADAPAPLLARRGASWLAAFFELSAGRESGRVLSVRSFAGEGPAVTVASLPQRSDDSMASDIASDGRGAFAVWDEASSASRGVIRGAFLPEHGPAALARDVSPPESDAEVPRVFWTGANYSVLWLARGVDPSAASDAAEVVGEARTFGWVQIAELDALGVAHGPARDVTPRTGHVSAFDARALAAGPLLVVARDDGEGGEGALLLVRVRAGSIDAVQQVPGADGLGRGAPLLSEGRPPWLTWVGRDEQLRLLPLDDRGAPGGLISVEDTMNEARPLVAIPSPPASPLRWLLAVPGDPNGPLRTVVCAPRETP